MPNIRVFMEPTPEQAKKDLTTSIFAIVLKLQEFMPTYGVEVVDDPDTADVIASHAGMGSGKYTADVSILHGMLWTGLQNADAWAYRVNAHIISVMKQSKKITVPSQWVADTIRRDLRVEPEVIPWAVDHSLFRNATPSPDKYILWGKTRIDFSVPIEPLEEFARRLPKVQFVSTYGRGSNIRATGRVIYPKMVELINGSTLYLSTTLESFGIQTLECLSAGVPVIGFDFGGNSELVKTGVNGYLVPEGDIEGLVKAYSYCIEHRDILSQNARKMAQIYTWKKTARAFAKVFKQVYTEKQPCSPKVSVVIPLYNYQQYVKEAIQSVSTQTDVDYELLVVDDGSTDSSKVVAEAAVKEYFGSSTIHATVLTKPNGGVASTRNWGIERAVGKYVLCLDADDRLGDPKLLKALADGLDSDPALGIAYTGLGLMNAEGKFLSKSAWPGVFSYDFQAQGKNQVPTCCMYRKEAWRRAGKYKRKYEPAEDAELWLSITTFGYTAKQITDAPWFIYRLHSGSLSDTIRKAQKKEPDWYHRAYLKDGLWPFAAGGNPPHFSWPVRYYINPVVSIIIPVGPGHEELVKEAIESVYEQSFWKWELIVIDDTGGKQLAPDDYPFARFLKTTGKQGAGAARNKGLAEAKGQFVVFLDADDTLQPEFLVKTLAHYQETGRYVYTDWLDSSGALHNAKPYDQFQLVYNLSLHAITALIPTVWARAVGGFDETLHSWEDSDFFIKLALNEYCGARLPEALFTYRYQAGKRREQGLADQEQLKAIFFGRYGAYIQGEKKMCCGKKAPAVLSKKTQTTQEAESTDLVRIQYGGPVADATVRSPITGQYYGRRKRGDIFFVMRKDAEALPSLFKPVASAEFEIARTETVVDPPKLLG